MLKRVVPVLVFVAALFNQILLIYDYIIGAGRMRLPCNQI